MSERSDRAMRRQVILGKRIQAICDAPTSRLVQLLSAFGETGWDACHDMVADWFEEAGLEGRCVTHADTLRRVAVAVYMGRHG